MVVNKTPTNNKFYPILTLKRSFAASIKWFAFRYLNIVKGFTIMWTFLQQLSDFSLADWSRAMVDKSADHRNDVMVTQFNFSFSWSILL